METVWYLYRDGKQLGPWSHEQLKAFYNDKNIVTGDLYWQEGMPSWEAVTEQVLGRNHVMTSPTVVLQPPASQIVERIPETKIEAPIVVPVVAPIQPVQLQPVEVAPIQVQSTAPIMSAIPEENFPPPHIPTSNDIQTSDVALSEGPKGLGGWMVLVVLGSIKALIFSFLSLIWLISNLSSLFSNTGVDEYKILLFALAAVFGGLMAFLWSLNLNKNLFLTKAIFPNQFRALLGIPLLIGSCLLLFGLLQRSGSSNFLTPLKIPTLIEQAQSPFGIHISPELLTLGVGLIAILVAGVLALYTAKSRRVKNTFVN